MKRSGSPVEHGRFIAGSIGSGGDSGVAFLECSVSGPDERGGETVKAKIDSVQRKNSQEKRKVNYME